MWLDLSLAAVLAYALAWKLDAVNALISPGGFPLHEAKAAHAALATALAVLPHFLPARLRRPAWWLLALSSSSLALVDTMYLRYFDAVPPVRALLYGSQAIGVKASLGALFQPRDLWLFLDVLLLAPLLLLRPTPLAAWVRVAAAAAVLACAWRLEGLIATFEVHHPRALATAWNPRYIAATLGLGTYHLVDLANTTRTALAPAPTDARVAKIAGWLDQHDPDHAQGPLAGAARGANLIVIQVEALQGFTLGLEVAGSAVTPALTAFAKESLAFPNLYAQTGDGNTADAEFLANTGCYPLDHGAAFVCYPHNTYASLAHRLAPAGYRSVVMHANEPAFWNRYLMYPALGFAEFFGAPAFALDERVGPGLADRSFLRQARERLEKLPRPFHATLVTLSSHHPYDDTAHFGPFQAGPFEGRMLGNYLHAIHYADTQLGAFLAALKQDGLLDTSVVVLYGDHPGLGREQFDDLLQALGTGQADRLAWLRQQKVPLLIHLPGGKGAGSRPAPGGQVDIMPTVAHLMGISAHGTFGRDLLGPGAGWVVLRDGSVIEGGTYFDATERQAFALADGRPVQARADEALALGRHHLAYSNEIVKHDLVPRLNAAGRPAP